MKIEIDADPRALAPGIRERVEDCRDAIEGAVTSPTAGVLIYCVEEEGPDGPRVVVNMVVREGDRGSEPEPFALDDLNDCDRVHGQMKRAWAVFIAGGGSGHD